MRNTGYILEHRPNLGTGRVYTSLGGGYSIALKPEDGSPMVINNYTGRTFVLTSEELVQIALEAGLNNPLVRDEEKEAA